MVIGLDGATWKVIDPLLKEGKMPHMARLIEGGTRCVSSAFGLALSPIMWTSIASGKRPEKHGVTHFFDTANNVRCRRLWDILERPDRPIGLFAWPVTWPPKPLNGFMIPSLFARDSDTYPTELQFVKKLEEGLNKEWGERVRLIGNAMRYGLRPTTIVDIAGYFVRRKLSESDTLHDFARQRFIKQQVHLDMYTYLVKQYDPYYTSFYLNQIDALSHIFWQYYEPDLFPDVEAEEVRRYGHMIPLVYRMADKAIGHLIELIDKDTLVVVVSDHGFEAATTPSDQGKLAARILGNKLLDALDLSRTVSYVNHRNVLVCKILHQRQITLDILRRIRVREMNQPLLDVYEENTGEVVIRLAKTANYRGVDLEELHVTWPDGEEPFLKLVELNEASTPGVHHLDGIAIFYGPGVEPGGCVADGSVLDVTPTVLALLGMPVGRDMDGRVLTDAVTTEFLKENPITYIDTYDAGLELEEIADEEPVSEELLTRLRALGYIE
jgi:predicted AlkP superfamily pyrophosphatase or phosphodiesterase